MSTKFSTSFKLQAVEKALTRSEGTTLLDITELLGISHSTLSRWIRETSTTQGLPTMTNEIKPNDLSLQERLNHIKNCSSLEQDALSSYCRENGIYLHHISQWENDFTRGTDTTPQLNKMEVRALKQENQQLKKDVLRKDKALAETAALLVLQKKVHEIWGNDEDSSR